MTEHWWRVPDVESIILSLDMDSDELDAWCEAAHNAREIERQIERHCQCKKKKAAAAEKASTSAPAATTTTTTTTMLTAGTSTGTKRKADQ